MLALNSLFFCSVEGPGNDKITAAAYIILNSTIEDDLEDQEGGVIMREDLDLITFACFLPSFLSFFHSSFPKRKKITFWGIQYASF